MTSADSAPRIANQNAIIAATTARRRRTGTAPSVEGIALHEAHRLNIPVVGTLDTNCDPDDVDYGIPANDDAIRSVRLLADFVADAVIAGTGAPVTAAEMEAAPAEAAPAEEAPAAE